MTEQLNGKPEKVIEIRNFSLLVEVKISEQLIRKNHRNE